MLGYTLLLFPNVNKVYANPEDQPAVPLVKCDSDGNPYTVAGAVNCSATWEQNPHNCYHCWTDDGIKIHYGWYDLPDGYVYDVGSTRQQGSYTAKQLIFGDTGSWCSNAMCGCKEECACAPRACPPTNPQNKYMTLAVPTNGTSRTCGDPCHPVEAACAPSYVNSAPSCSILPGKITMTREEAAKQFQLSVVDADYGDAIDVVSVKVKDSAGNLNSCVKVTNLAGGSLIGPVKNNQTNTFSVDAREAHGIFTNIGGKSICSGKLEIGIVDIDSDGPAGADTSAGIVKCSVDVEVTNEAPKLGAVKLYDQDADTQLRDTNNLINGTNTSIAIGSPVNSTDKLRASYCNEPLSLLDPIKCPQGGEKFLQTRHNPLQFEFTVSDANGADDIMQAGVWLSYYNSASMNDKQINVPLVMPVANPSTRMSFQALYSEKESKDINGTYYFISRACLSPACGPTNLATSSKQIFSAYAPIDSLPPYAGDGLKSGNLYKGKQLSATTNEWYRAGFPDCLLAGGCTSANVPATARSVATSANVFSLPGYTWAIGAEDNNLLCYPTNSAQPKVVQVSTPVACPKDCGACIQRAGISTSGSEITAKFKLYFNDKDEGQGLAAGQYFVFISSLDKVGVPLENVVGQGDEGWSRIDKFGKLCVGASCTPDRKFALLYDPIPPKISFDSWTPSASQLDTITATATVTDNVGGSGVSGISNRFIARQATLDGEPIEGRLWAKKLSDSTDLDGSQDHDPTFSGGVTTIKGKGLIPEETIIAGLCAYDNAGNMACSKNVNDYVFLSSWIKTSFGDIYSSKSAAPPFSQTIPSNTTINAILNTDNTAKQDAIKSPYTAIYSPFNEQIFTAGTGALLTGSTSGAGLTGGYIPNGSTTSLPLGFQNFYRDGGTTTKYNGYGVSALTQGNEFERTRATAILNCDLMNESNQGTCQTSGSIIDMSSSGTKYKILSSGTTTIDSTICSNVNVIFVSGTVTVKGNVTKANPESGCLFVLSNNASLIIEDIPSNQRTAAPDGKGSPYTDRFQAAVVASSGAQISIKKAATKAANNSIDRLEITGWIYAADKTPNFLRSLAPVDNRRYPAEWIIYDATLLDTFRKLLGIEKTVDVICGTSSHVLCTSSK